MRILWAMARSIDSVPEKVSIPTIVTESDFQFDNVERSMHKSVTDSTLREQESSLQ